jgi:nitronate monooxygenase/enoyl-[acyl-carrier protein] reductase II
MAIRTPLCDLLGIEHPVICAPFGPWPQVELAAAVSEAGGLGSLGTAVRPLESLQDDWRRMRELTSRPFAVNHTRRPFDEEAFAATLEARPAVISFHIGDPMDLIDRAHAEGVLWMHQVGTVEQARTALDAGADVLIAQGWEAGGNAGDVAMAVLVPQVVDIAGSTPVVAAGGVGDGRGLAAALVLGAQGVNVGTRFVASTEMRASDAWKQAIVAADATDAVKLTFAALVMPPYTDGAYTTMTPRALRNAFVDTWNADVAGAEARSEQLAAEVMAAVGGGSLEELLPFTGQSAALVRDVRPAAEILDTMVREAEEALAAASRRSTS